MSVHEATKPGVRTSEWKVLAITTVINLLVGIFGGVIQQWGVEINPDTLITAILSNTGLAASYTLGRSHIKAKALE